MGKIEKKKKGAISIAGLMTGAMMGWLMGSSFDNVAFRIPMMFIWAMMFNMIFSDAEYTLVKRRNEDATI